MKTNIEKQNKDLERLIADGDLLLQSMLYECYPDQFEKKLRDDGLTDAKLKELKEKLPDFHDKYQSWYSESVALVRFLLPDRLTDFVRLYEKPKGRKEILYGNYVIEDYLQNLTVRRSSGGEPVVSPKAAIPQFRQQLNILKSARRRFDSSLFAIKQLLQADLFDSELEAAGELSRNGFVRGAGAMAGVVLEAHLAQVCENHRIKVSKKDPTINDVGDLLKANNVIEISVWRFIQHLADLRNKCDHKKTTDPTEDEVNELIEGVEKVTKTVF